MTDLRRWTLAVLAHPILAACSVESPLAEPEEADPVAGEITLEIVYTDPQWLHFELRNESSESYLFPGGSTPMVSVQVDLAGEWGPDRTGLASCGQAFLSLGEVAPGAIARGANLRGYPDRPQRVGLWITPASEGCLRIGTEDTAARVIHSEPTRR